MNGMVFTEKNPWLPLVAPTSVGPAAAEAAVGSVGVRSLTESVQLRWKLTVRSTVMEMLESVAARHTGVAATKANRLRRRADRRLARPPWWRLRAVRAVRVVTLVRGLMLNKGTPGVTRRFAGPDIPPILSPL